MDETTEPKKLPAVRRVRSKSVDASAREKARARARAWRAKQRSKGRRPRAVRRPVVRARRSGLAGQISMARQVAQLRMELMAQTMVAVRRALGLGRSAR